MMTPKAAGGCSWSKRSANAGGRTRRRREAARSSGQFVAPTRTSRPLRPKGGPVPDDPPPIPALVCHYASYLATWLQVTPDTRVHGNQAELRLNFGNKMFVAIFGSRKEGLVIAQHQDPQGGRPPRSPVARWPRRWPRYSEMSCWPHHHRRSKAPPGRELTPRFASDVPLVAA